MAKRRLQLYINDLRGIPNDILTRACERLRCDSETKFFPTPGQILDECDNVIHNIPSKREIEHEKALHAHGLYSDREWRIFVGGYRRSRVWANPWGPEPPNLGCKAPAYVLVEFGYRKEDAA